jgi:hypothetical protein
MTLTEKIGADLQRVLPQVRRLVAKLIDQPSAKSMATDLQIPRTLLKELVNDPRVLDADNRQVELACQTAFMKVADAIVALKVSYEATSQEFVGQCLGTAIRPPI